MEEVKERIRNIANNICKRDTFIQFNGKSGEESILSNLVDYYIINLYNEQKYLELITIFNDIFPTLCDITYSFYFSTFIISSISRIQNPKIVDFEDFLLKQVLITQTNKDPYELLLNFSANCFSSLFQSNDQLFVQSLKTVISSPAKFSTYVIKLINFPPFRSLQDVNEISSLMIKSNKTSPELTAKVIESFLITEPSNIPAKIDVPEDNIIKTLFQFAFSIIKNDKNHQPLLEIMKNITYIDSILKIAEKYFTISTDENKISDFILYLHFFRENRQYQTNLTAELLSNINPSNINQAYDITRELCRYNIYHLTSPHLNDNVLYLKKLTDYCLSNIVVDNSNATTQFVNMLNSSEQEIHIYPYKKIERLCFYLFFRKSEEIRQNSFDLLAKESQLFELENSDWKEYEFSSQPLYRQFLSETASYIRKNTDFLMETRQFVSHSSLLNPALKYILRRFSNNRPEFACKVLKESIILCESQPFMVTLLFTAMTPYLLRQKCSKKIDIQHKLFYRFARSNVDALSMLDTAYLVDYLQFVGDNEVEMFLQLTRSAIANMKAIQKSQIQEQINVIVRFEKSTKVALVAESLLNIVAQLEVIYPKEKMIRLTRLNDSILAYLSNSSLEISNNPIISESFLTYSNFLIENGVNFKVRFIKECDEEFFSKVYSKYPNSKDDIVYEALHFIPSIVCKYFLKNDKNESVSKLSPEISGYLFSEKNEELDHLFLAKYPQVKQPINYENVINFLDAQQKKMLLYYSCQFFATPFIDEIGERVFATIYRLKDLNPISQITKNEINTLYHFLFKHPQVSPKDLFFTDEEGSYQFFKSLVEYGMSEEVVSELLEECPHSKTVSERFLTEDWQFIEKGGNEQINENTIKAFRAIVNNEEIREKLENNCQNVAAYRVYLRNVISKAIEENQLSIDFVASILSNENEKLDYLKVVEFFVAEMTDCIRENKENVSVPELNMFFEVCILVVHLGNDRISKAVYNFIDLVLNEETVRQKLFDQDFVSNIVKISMIDDSFLSIITENKMKIKISEFLNINNDREVRFWYNLIYRKFDIISKEGFDFIISNVSKALEFNSMEMKQRCLMALALIMPERQNISEMEKNSVKNFVQYLVLSNNVDPKFGHHIILFIDEALGPFDIKFTDVDIEVYRNSVDDIRNYFKSLMKQ